MLDIYNHLAAGLLCLFLSFVQCFILNGDSFKESSIVAIIASSVSMAFGESVAWIVWYLNGGVV